MSGPALWRWHGRAGRVAANNSSAAAFQEVVRQFWAPHYFLSLF